MALVQSSALRVATANERLRPSPVARLKSGMRLQTGRLSTPRAHSFTPVPPRKMQCVAVLRRDSPTRGLRKNERSAPLQHTLSLRQEVKDSWRQLKSVENLEGVWKQVGSEGLDEYLEALGYSATARKVMRALGRRSKETIQISDRDGQLKVTSHSLKGTWQRTLSLGKPHRIRNANRELVQVESWVETGGVLVSIQDAGKKYGGTFETRRSVSDGKLYVKNTYTSPSGVSSSMSWTFKYARSPPVQRRKKAIQHARSGSLLRDVQTPTHEHKFATVEERLGEHDVQQQMQHCTRLTRNEDTDEAYSCWIDLERKAEKGSVIQLVAQEKRQQLDLSRGPLDLVEDAPWEEQLFWFFRVFGMSEKKEQRLKDGGLLGNIFGGGDTTEVINGVELDEL